MSFQAKKIFVGVSGGVDSSVTAALLKEQGHDVVGVFIRTWQPKWIECNWKEERRDAMRVCAHLAIPFIELDLEDEYKRGVADYMISEYRKGRTPNPDVMCNKEVKFGGFLKWALRNGADYIATGHYVRRSQENDHVFLKKGVDEKKDQSYFLWTLQQEQLKHILFPVGELRKEEVRKEAQRFELPTAQKKDSQGICFIGEIDMKEFLSYYIDEHPGDILSIDGCVIGKHKGALLYTIGERHGLSIDAQYKGVNDSPYYVIAKDIENNTLSVSQDPSRDHSDIRTEYVLINVVDNISKFKDLGTYEAQIRYHGDLKKITILSYQEDKKSMNIIFDVPDPSIAEGQSVVIYSDDICLGGGIIQ